MKRDLGDSPAPVAGTHLRAADGAGAAVGRLEAVCLSAERGRVKSPVDGAELRADYGLIGDAHAGPGPRQVSVLGAGSIARIKRVLPDLPHGAFAENLVVSGIDLRLARPGDRLAVGPCGLLEVAQIGKECHNACAIREATGDCVMPGEGVFCRVLAGGPVRPGDGVRLLPAERGRP